MYKTAMSTETIKKRTVFSNMDEESKKVEVFDAENKTLRDLIDLEDSSACQQAFERTFAINMIESDDLRKRLEDHQNFLEQQELKSSENIAFTFQSKIEQHSVERQGRISDLRFQLKNSILFSMVRAFNFLPIPYPETLHQFSEISLEEFSEALKVSDKNFNERLSPVDYGQIILAESCHLYLSYALTLISARKLLLLMIEANEMFNQNDSVDFEKFLTAVEMLASDEYENQPVEWILRVI